MEGGETRADVAESGWESAESAASLLSSDRATGVEAVAAMAVPMTLVVQVWSRVPSGQADVFGENK